ncbi:Grap2 and cyclin-D-interacting-domain-containing protein [Syncephalis pseudoplumigaleata]|uniref:Grap2 and cyclin-D-interacting-domain-containing protein n=1 Tax=Syncephalis pseudoplumigaleata TaxID=1712513 RepID=A0A4P9Z1Z7_9FUNG|nr:Grap2 and cyclin-D-interacting-domain-containing protein [Syncephalis pseudoplumigaleata]|eukprot:RKP25460.1 Grap2 and cyclin-D-interacting-domain-containing protein [Syncephalis pseudoplumigaleata]
MGHQVTRISLVCEHGSLPSDTPTFIDELRKELDALHAMQQEAPSSVGLTLVKAIDDAVDEVIDAVYAWATTLRDRLAPPATPEARATLDAEVRSKTGLVWRACTALSTLPPHNTEAVMRRWLDQHALVEDAIEEFTAALEETSVDTLADHMEQLTVAQQQEEKDDDGEDMLRTEWARDIHQCTLASVKLIQRLLCKVEQRGIRGGEQVPPTWQDRCLAAVEQLAEQVDQLGDVFWFLPSDVDAAREDARDHLDALYKAAGVLAELAREQFADAHRTWLDLCLQQLDVQRQSLSSS